MNFVKLFLVIFFFYIGITNTVALTINMWAGRNLDNFGDIASNVRMLGLIKERFPYAQINFWYSDEQIQKLKFLITDTEFLNNPKGSFVTINGINFYYENES